MNEYKPRVNLGRLIILIIFPLIVVGCGKSAENPVLKEEKTETAVPATLVYQADPTVFYHNGAYYLYGTNDNNADNGFLVYTSNDLKKWKAKGYALRKGEAFGDWGF